MDNFNAHKWFKNQYLKESDDPKIGAELEAGMFGTGVAEGEEGINEIDNKQCAKKILNLSNPCK